jgi:ankyrin repeat protein
MPKHLARSCSPTPSKAHRCTELVTKKHAQLEFKGASDFTALLLAAKHGHADTCRALLELKADANAITTHGRCALDLAAARGHLVCVELFISQGKVDAVTAVGTPLAYAALFGHRDVCSRLLQANANINMLTNFGRIGAITLDCSLRAKKRQL